MNLDPAYVAGILDGEGCLTVGLNRKARTYDARTYVGMTEPAKTVLESLAQDFGGSIKTHRKATTKWETAYIWTLSGKKVIPLLKTAIPFLQIKTKQAALLLSLESLKQENAVKGKCRWTEEIRHQAATIRATIFDLNRKGPTPSKSQPVEGGDFVRDVDGFLMEAREPDLFDVTLWQPWSGRFGNTIISAASGLWTLDTSEWPNDEVAYSECSLGEILLPESPRKYWLSPKAAAGILRRAAKRKKTLPPHLEAALIALASMLPDEAAKTIKTSSATP